MLGTGQGFSTRLNQAYPVAAAFFQAEAQQFAKGWLWGCHEDIFRHVKSLSLPMVQGKRRNISDALQFDRIGTKNLQDFEHRSRLNHIHLLVPKQAVCVFQVR